MGASFTIGSYVIPGECLNRISESIGNDVNLSIDVSEKIIDGIKDKTALDIGLIEVPLFHEDLIYREWFTIEA